jgi:hypothetical protein
MSVNLSDASSNLSKPEPESLTTGLQNRSKAASAANNTFALTLDASTNAITVTSNGNSRMFGTNNPDSIHALMQQVCGFLSIAPNKPDLQKLKYALSTISGIGPKDELEGLLAVQMMGVHSLAVKCLTRASLKDQTEEGIDANIHRATKLLRTFTTQMEALNRHRGKISQPIVVGNVNVNDGGQAIVGPAHRDGPGKAYTEDDTAKIQ